MGYLLKEALKTLCGVNQWSYAVFWKFGCQNPKLLIWEECYYEPISYSNLPRISGTVNSETGLDNRDACWVSADASTSQLPVPGGNKIHLLVNKMMMENHVSVVGEGLVGRAAFTGNHQWVLSEKYTGEAHPPEVLKEVCQQLSAGMQTVAVIPVLPHGVVQLGSCFAIMENLAFVNDVKNLVLQLGCVSGVLLSDDYATKEPAPKIGLPVYHGNTISVDPIDPAHFTESSNYQVNSTQAARFMGLTSGSSTVQMHDNLKYIGTTLQASKIAKDVKSNDDHCQTKIATLTNPNLLSVGQLLSGATNSEVIPSNSDIWLNQSSSSLCSPRSTFQHHSTASSFVLNRGSSRLLEQRILPGLGFKNHTDGNLNTSDGFTMSPLQRNTRVVSSSCEDAVINPSVGVTDSFNDINSHLNAALDCSHVGNRSYDNNIPSMNPARNGSSSKTEDNASCVIGNVANKSLFSGPCSADNIRTEQNEMKLGAENDLFRAIGVPRPAHNEYSKLNEHIPGFCHEDEKLHAESSSVKHSQYEDAFMQPMAGDDLFDILGVDFRNKLLNGSWADFPSNGSDSNTNSQNLDNNKSTSWACLDAASDLYSVNQGNSESGIFSVNGSDHLLDAVVSRIHRSNKQNLDDAVSCKTTLTNMSSSSIPSTSHSYGQAGVSNPMKGELLGLSKSLITAGSLSSCSFRSGSSKDNPGTYSQSSSMYGSQMSAWGEQGRDVKQSSSVSTAYSKKPDEASRTNRKRLKPGENPRPRPKDRQMIQDRVKELREIVPNGAKCSIDALLERTIKHMLFLQSVTKHADKLKQTGESKILSREGGLLLKDNFEGGATWAYEVGSQSMVCPIVVEDLNQPRQMLVEMLCEERGLFLEIADIIRGLGLTILKGVMETRNEKIWARFAVEANRDVTRMEIFLSLVRLLEQTAKGGAIPAGFENDAMMVHQLHQASTIPATGKACRMQ